MEDQIEAVQGILEQLNLEQTQQLLVLNKLDISHEAVVQKLSARYSAVAVSALRSKTLPALLERLEQMVDGVEQAPVEQYSKEEYWLSADGC